ncbi:MAG TPA: trypsin-like serine protease [Polyangiaceae bacterium]|nr:trypsin-like serine protease [Polyangiaceae bacterium]
MHKMNMQRVVWCLGALLSACSGEAGLATDELGTGRAQEEIIRASQTGGRNEVVMIYATTINPSTGSLGTRTCTGSYFAPRVVLTAAHCLENVWADQVFIYYGDNFSADFSQLTQVGDTYVPPPPGTPSFWSQADSFEQHPQWDPNLIYPDIGVVYLDRKLPFDPLPLARFRLDSTWVNRQVTISGWGANSAPTPTTGAGAGVQRTGTTKILGSPTAADYHPEDPNPGMLNATVRNHTVKIDGRAPNANSCFGDSGGPIIVNQSGQNYIAGVSYFGGLSCEQYGLYVRIDPFLPFLDQAYKKGGQETLIPFLECVAPNPSGTYTAYFGYQNKNGVTVTVPYGTKNQLAPDTVGWRPTLFEPGTHNFVFGADIPANQSITYTLSPDNSPTTTLTVNRNSKPCTAAQAAEVECGNYCRAASRSGCSGISPALSSCISECVSFKQFIDEALPGCSDEYAAVNTCVAAVPPGTPQNWTCISGSLPSPATACQSQGEALNNCFVNGG